MFDGLDQFQLFGGLPGSGADLLEDGEGTPIGESVGVIAFVRTDFRAARKARDAQLQVRTYGAKHAQSRYTLLTVVAIHVRQGCIAGARHGVGRGDIACYVLSVDKGRISKLTSSFININ